MPGSHPGADGDAGDLHLPDLLLAAAFARGGEDAPRPVTHVLAGTQFGSYRILHRLGSGGMGTVYLAEQRHPRRRVALKLLTPTHGSRSMVQRFLQEAQLLGGLQHPGIAQIHEAGTVALEGLAAPLHYLALELVEGRSLDAWVSERGLALPARLELVARVCDAVEHAHQRGVVHRDLKPANVLVVDDGQGGPGQPKVLDFGVARALDESVGAQVTLDGQLVGTLAYMSPEQASGDSRALDARSDIYALGVMLYRLLCEASPVEVSGLPLIEAARRIREFAPLRPSRRVPGLAADLDIIALKALAKSPEERYGSAAQLAGDLRRHLRGEPILAREQTAFYVLVKALARNRLLVAAAAALLVLSSAFALVAGLQARNNRLLAERVGRAGDDLARELRRSNIDRGRLFATAGHLQIAEDLLWSELARAPDSEEVLWGLRELYRRFPCLGTWAIGEGTVFDLLALGDGRLVSSGADGILRELRPPDFAPRQTQPEGEYGMQRMVLTPDGSRLVRLDHRRILTVFDSESLAPLWQRTLEGGPWSGFDGNAVQCRDDERVLVGLDDGRLLEVELREDGAVRVLAQLEEPISDLHAAPDHSLLAVGLAGGAVRLLELASGVWLWSSTGTGERVNRMQFDPQCARLYVGGRDRSVRVLDVADGGSLGHWSAPNGTVRNIELQPERDRALVGGWWSIDEWSLADGMRRVRLRHPIDNFRLTSGGEVLVTAGNRMLRTWAARVLDDPAPLVVSKGRSAAIFVAQGDLAAVGDELGRLTLFDPRDGAISWSAEVLDRRIRALSSDAQGARLFVAGEGGEIAVVDTRDGSVGERFGPVRAMTRGSLALHPDGRRLAYCEDAGSLVVRDLASGAVTVRIALQGIAAGIEWSPDGARMAVIDRPRGLVLFDARGAELAEAGADQHLWALRYSPDGETLAASGWRGEIHIFDGRTLRVRDVLRGHSATPWDLSFPNSMARHLLSAAGDGTLRLWDLDEARCLLVLDELDGWEGLSVDVARDGRRVLLASSVGAVHGLDLFAADRSIAGNLAYQSERLEREGALDVARERFEALVRAALGPAQAR